MRVTCYKAVKIPTVSFADVNNLDFRWTDPLLVMFIPGYRGTKRCDRMVLFMTFIPGFLLSHASHANQWQWDHDNIHSRFWINFRVDNDKNHGGEKPTTVTMIMVVDGGGGLWIWTNSMSTVLLLHRVPNMRSFNEFSARRHVICSCDTHMASSTETFRCTYTS